MNSNKLTTNQTTQEFQPFSNTKNLRVFPVEVAVVIGLDAAIILSQIHYWLSNPKAGYYIDGIKWIWNDYEDWLQQFPWMGSAGTVGRHIRYLESLGLVISGNFNNTPFDRRKWYRLDYEAIALVTGWNPLQITIGQNCTIADSVTENPISESATLNRIKDYQENKAANSTNAAAYNTSQVKNQENKYSIKVNPDIAHVSDNEHVTNLEIEIIHVADTKHVRTESAIAPVSEQAVGQLLNNDKENNLYGNTEHKEETNPAPNPVNPEANQIVAVLKEANLSNPQLRKLALQYSYDYVAATIKLCQERQRNNNKPIKSREGLFTEALKNNWVAENDLSPTSGIPACFVAWYEKACESGIIFEPCPIKHLPLDRYREPMVRIALDDSRYNIPFDCLPWKQAMAQYPLNDATVVQGREAATAPTEADAEVYEVEVNPADFELPEGYDPAKYG